MAGTQKEGGSGSTPSYPALHMQIARKIAANPEIARRWRSAG